MSRRASNSRKSRNSKAKTAPRNRRLDEVEVVSAEKVASKSGRKRKAASGKKTGSRREQRAEERRIRKEERQARREERREIWNERLAWMRDPRIVQSLGILTVALGGFMLLAGCSAVLTGGADIRLIQSGAEPGEGSFQNLLGALGARWAFAFMRGGFGIAAPLFGAWLVAAGIRLLAPERVPHLGRALRSTLVAAVLLPWTVGFATLSFDVGSGLVTGWGDDYLVGAVGLWLTQWSRFALGVAGSLLLLVSLYALWAIAHPKVSSQLLSFFAREEVDEGLEDNGDEDEESDIEEEGLSTEEATAEEDWDPYMAPERMPVSEVTQSSDDGGPPVEEAAFPACLLYTSDAADE